jgi:pyruvate dehydrogenase E2 component (dihydrolipoamide acetyltransferase)
MAKRPVVEGDAVVARLTLPLSVSVDHRVIDGVAAARFLEALVQTLEAPLRLLL